MIWLEEANPSSDRKARFGGLFCVWRSRTARGIAPSHMPVCQT